MTSQAFQRFRRGGSRLAFFATLCEVSGINPSWLVLGSRTEPRLRRAQHTLAGASGAAQTFFDRFEIENES